MSTTPQPPPDASAARKPPSAAARYLFVFLLGLVLGIVALVMLMRSLEARKTWRDHYPDAVMHLLSAQTAQLRDNVAANRCSPTDTLPLTTRAKALMAAQALIALVTALLVVARAVNILG